MLEILFFLENATKWNLIFLKQKAILEYEANADNFYLDQ